MRPQAKKALYFSITPNLKHEADKKEYRLCRSLNCLPLGSLPCLNFMLK